MRSFAHELQIHLGLAQHKEGGFRVMPLSRVDEFIKTYDLYKAIVETFQPVPNFDERMMFIDMEDSEKKLGQTKFAQLIAKEHLDDRG